MTSPTTLPRHASEAVTGGIRVTALPRFEPAQSAVERGTWVFRYHIRIGNESENAVTLQSRYWMIVDSSGHTHEVRGDGVIGRTPRIEPGGYFEYESYCPLNTAWGTMEGSYTFSRATPGDTFEATVARFYLVS
jgi:ApaG protein